MGHPTIRSLGPYHFNAACIPTTVPAFLFLRSFTEALMPRPQERRVGESISIPSNPQSLKKEWCVNTPAPSFLR